MWVQQLHFGFEGGVVRISFQGIISEAQYYMELHTYLSINFSDEKKNKIQYIGRKKMHHDMKTQIIF